MGVRALPDISPSLPPPRPSLCPSTRATAWSRGESHSPTHFHARLHVQGRSAVRLNDAQQQNQTRWSAYQAAALLKKYEKEYVALQEAMAAGKTVAGCIRAIEEC